MSKLENLKVIASEFYYSIIEKEIVREHKDSQNAKYLVRDNNSQEIVFAAKNLNELQEYIDTIQKVNDFNPEYVEKISKAFDTELEQVILFDDINRIDIEIGELNDFVELLNKAISGELNKTERAIYNEFELTLGEYTCYSLYHHDCVLELDHDDVVDIIEFCQAYK